MINQNSIYVNHEHSGLLLLICSKNFCHEYAREFIVWVINSKNFEIYLCKRVSTKKTIKLILGRAIERIKCKQCWMYLKKTMDLCSLNLIYVYVIMKIKINKNTKNHLSILSNFLSFYFIIQNDIISAKCLSIKFKWIVMTYGSI